MRHSVYPEALASPECAASNKDLITYSFLHLAAQVGLRKSLMFCGNFSPETNTQYDFHNYLPLLSLALKSFVVSFPPFSLPIIRITTSNTKCGYSGHCENVFFPSVLMK